MENEKPPDRAALLALDSNGPSYLAGRHAL